VGVERDDGEEGKVEEGNIEEKMEEGSEEEYRC
jgi:hypothetical protein